MEELSKKSGEKIILESFLFSKENIFTNLADSAPFMIWIADDKGLILQVKLSNRRKETDGQKVSILMTWIIVVQLIKQISMQKMNTKWNIG